MDSNKKKKLILIILGTIITIFTMVQSFLEADKDVANAIEYYFEDLFLLFFLDKDAVIRALGLILLTIGIFIDSKELNLNNKTILKKQIRKYKILKYVGYIPFVGVIFAGLISIFGGFTFLFSTSYGIEAFFGSILVLSAILWPFYIVGLFLIITSNKKIKKLSIDFSIDNEENKEKGIPFTINNSQETNNNN